MLETKERIEVINAAEGRRERHEFERVNEVDGIQLHPPGDNGNHGLLFHHHPHHKPHSDLISVMYTEEKMRTVFGPFWGRECENISKEPPEIKMVFALLMGFKVCLNRPLTEEEKKEPSVDFDVDFDTSRLSLCLGLDEDVCTYIIKKAPDGIATVIKGFLATLK